MCVCVCVCVCARTCVCICANCVECVLSLTSSCLFPCFHIPQMNSCQALPLNVHRCIRVPTILMQCCKSGTTQPHCVPREGHPIPTYPGTMGHVVCPTDSSALRPSSRCLSGRVVHRDRMDVCGCGTVHGTVGHPTLPLTLVLKASTNIQIDS